VRVAIGSDYVDLSRRRTSPFSFGGRALECRGERLRGRAVPPRVRRAVREKQYSEHSACHFSVSLQRARALAAKGVTCTAACHTSSKATGTAHDPAGYRVATFWR